MTTQTEQQLRDLFAFDASRVSTVDGLAEAARQRARRRCRKQLAWVAGVAAVLVGTGGAISLTAGWLSPQASTPLVAAPSAPSRVGALPDGRVNSCVESYSPTAVARRAFAFDGTVVEIGPARTNRAGAELPLVAVTFHVNQWFHGGSSASVIVDMAQPIADGAGAPIDEASPSYGVGTRLLVSGEPRWGGAPLDDPIAWGCGFTRYHDTDTAGLWRDTAK